jgi:glycosyltransferase involved in cell wall biosynthesis
MNNSADEQISNSALRTAILLDETSFTNYAEIIRHILTGLADECTSTAIVCPQAMGEDLAFNSHITRMVHPAYKFPLLWRQNQKILLSKLIEFKPDVLHCFSASQSMFANSIAKSLDIPYVVSVDSINDRPHVSASHCASIISSCSSVDSFFKKKHPRFSQKLELVNLATFVEDSCACFDSSSTLTGIIIVSPFDDIKRFEPVLSAIRHLAIDGYEFILFMIGSGKAEQKIRRLLKSLGLSNIVNIVPLINPLREILKEGDIFIQPGTDERFNPYILEAMSVGMIVAGCQGGIDDLLLKNETAVIFDPADELSVYSTLQQILDKREWARQIAVNAQSNLRKNYSVSKMVSSLIEIYGKARSWYQTAHKAD